METLAETKQFVSDILLKSCIGFYSMHTIKARTIIGHIVYEKLNFTYMHFKKKLRRCFPSKTDKYHWIISKFVENGSVYELLMPDQTKPLIIQNKRRFSLFCVFPKISFWTKNEVFSVFLQHGWADRTQNVFTNASS